VKIPIPTISWSFLLINWKFKKKRLTTRCVICQKPTVGSRKYCSPECRKVMENIKSEAKVGDRNKEIIDLALQGKTLEQIGDEYNLTRERIRQILSRESRKYRLTIKPSLIHSPKVTIRCSVCNKEFLISQKVYQSARVKLFFCSLLCRENHFFPKLNCDFCGKEFRRRRTLIKRSVRHKLYTGEHYFCSQPCFRKFMKQNPPKGRAKEG